MQKGGKYFCKLVVIVQTLRWKDRRSGEETLQKGCPSSLFVLYLISQLLYLAACRGSLVFISREFLLEQVSSITKPDAPELKAAVVKVC